MICRVIGSTYARALAGFVDDVASEKVELISTDARANYFSPRPSPLARAVFSWSTKSCNVFAVW